MIVRGRWRISIRWTSRSIGSTTSSRSRQAGAVEGQDQLSSHGCECLAPRPVIEKMSAGMLTLYLDSERDGALHRLSRRMPPKLGALTKTVDFRDRTTVSANTYPGEIVTSELRSRHDRASAAGAESDRNHRARTHAVGEPTVEQRQSPALVVDVNRGPFAQVNYGTGKDVSDESIADAKEPLRIERFNDSYVEVPVTLGDIQ
jgi:hypothetical protein